MELNPIPTFPMLSSVGEGQVVVPTVMAAIIVSINSSSITGLLTQAPHFV